jgi:hypothetical protein
MSHEGSSVMSFRVGLDAKRRPTLPAALLREAHIDPSHDLIARADGEGRIVLEDPVTLLASFQSAVLAGKAERGETGSLADDLLADRAADSSASE